VTTDTGVAVNSAHVTDRRGAQNILDFAEEGVNANDAGKERCRKMPCKEKKRQRRAKMPDPSSGRRD
jgi:hypothetical protein